MCLLDLKGRVRLQLLGLREWSMGAAGFGDGERGWPMALTHVQDSSKHRAVGRERSRPGIVSRQEDGFC